MLSKELYPPCTQRCDLIANSRAASQPQSQCTRTYSAYANAMYAQLVALVVAALVVTTE
jgi:hypothetical protein